MNNDPIVGHKTFANPDGSHRHEPLLQSEADAMLVKIEASDTRRKSLMPDERAAICMLMDAYLRLKELGWNDAQYCPKDGTRFDSIEIGSTGIRRCFYSGVWPNGVWYTESHDDLWPARPILYRGQPKPEYPEVVK